MKWKYDKNILKYIKSQTSKHDSKENFFFYLYLNKTGTNNRFEHSTTTPAIASTTVTPNRHNSLAIYRIINAFNAVSSGNDLNAYEYNLTNLSNMPYMFYLSARYELLESHLAGPIVLYGPRKYFILKCPSRFKINDVF